MVEAQARSAITEQLTPGRFGAEFDGDVGVTISEVRDRTLVHIAGGPALSDATQAAAGLALPLDSGSVAIEGETRLCWLGPDQWLLKTAPAPFGEWERKLAAAAPDGAFNEVTHGRTTLRLRGPKARDVLAKGCPLDLDPGVFTPGHCAQSLLGHLSVLLDCVAADEIHVSVTRSYGVDLLDWMREAAAEYGFLIET